MKKIIITLFILGLILMSGCSSVSTKDDFCKSKGYDSWEWFDNNDFGDSKFYCTNQEVLFEYCKDDCNTNCYDPDKEYLIKKCGEVQEET